MLIIIDANTGLRKKLCDILKKERIIPVNSVMTALEKICHFRGEINVVISNVDYLLEIFSRKTISKVCSKLYINEPPVIGYFTSDKAQQRDELIALGADYPLLECSETDLRFPDKYIAEIVKVYPELNYDMEKAYHYWTKAPEQAAEYIDPRKWLLEQGFVDIIKQAEQEPSASPALEDTILAIQSMLEPPVETEVRNIDYKQLYLETKKQYDQLSHYVRELIEMMK
ncbi:MAG TPA: hypothetical protein VF399_09820 [bacterium]